MRLASPVPYNNGAPHRPGYASRCCHRARTQYMKTLATRTCRGDLQTGGATPRHFLDRQAVKPHHKGQLPHGLSLGLQFGVTVGAGSGCRLGRRRWIQVLGLRNSLSLTNGFITLPPVPAGPVPRYLRLPLHDQPTESHLTLALALPATEEVWRPPQIRHISYTNLTQFCMTQINVDPREGAT